MSHNARSDQGKIEALKSQRTLNPFPQKVLDPLFQSQEFFDPQDIVQVKYELLRRVQIEGVSVTDAAKSFGCSRLFFYRTRDEFEKLGLSGFIPQKRGPRQAHKLTSNVMKFINERIQENPSSSSVQLRSAIEETFGVSVHTRSIERALSRSKKKRKSL